MDKAWGQFRLQLNGIFSVFDKGDTAVFVPEAKHQVEILTKQLIERLNGKDVPIKVYPRIEDWGRPDD